MSVLARWFYSAKPNNTTHTGLHKVAFPSRKQKSHEITCSKNEKNKIKIPPFWLRVWVVDRGGKECRITGRCALASCGVSSWRCIKPVILFWPGCSRSSLTALYPVLSWSRVPWFINLKIFHRYLPALRSVNVIACLSTLLRCVRVCACLCIFPVSLSLSKCSRLLVSLLRRLFFF